jgi:hypothetical protein
MPFPIYQENTLPVMTINCSVKDSHNEYGKELMVLVTAPIVPITPISARVSVIRASMIPKEPRRPKPKKENEVKDR